MLNHSWKVSPKEAIEIQERLRSKVITSDDFGDIRTIAGTDISLEGDEGIAGVIAYSYPSIKEIERVHAREKIKFPYVPGLLAFREGPALLKVFQSLETDPDIIIFDGQGIAHPRGMGIASHMGIILNKPTIGCAKSHLFGEYEEPGKKAGNWSPLLMPKIKSSVRPEQGRRTKTQAVIGAVLRTRDNVKPVFISVGHKISLKTAVKIIMDCADGFRIPRPTREADHFVRMLKNSPHMSLRGAPRLCSGQAIATKQSS